MSVLVCGCSESVLISTRFSVEDVSDRADIYSFGCVIYEMLSLNVPHLPPPLDDSELDEQESFDENSML